MKRYQQSGWVILGVFLLSLVAEGRRRMTWNDEGSLRKFDMGASPTFPRLQFQATRMVEVVKTAQDDAAMNVADAESPLPLFLHSQVLHLSQNRVLSTYDDLNHFQSWIMLSVDRGLHWTTLLEFPNVISLTLFTKSENETGIVYAMGEAQTVLPTGQTTHSMVLYELFMDQYFHDLHVLELQTEEDYNDVVWAGLRGGKRRRRKPPAPWTTSNPPKLYFRSVDINNEYDYRLNNAALFHDTENNIVLKTIDIAPIDYHENHRARVLQASGEVQGNSGRIFLQCQLLGKPQDSRIYYRLASRFARGMKVEVGFGGIVGYVHEIRWAEEVVVVDVVQSNYTGVVDLETEFQETAFSQHLLQVISEADTLWHLLVWAHVEDDWIQQESWHFTNIISSYLAKNSELFEQALAIGIPTSQLPDDAMEMLPQAKGGIVMRKPDDSYSAYFSFKNQRLNDLALESALKVYQDEDTDYVENIWLSAFKFSTLPGSGINVPSIVHDDDMKAYWMVSYMGASHPAFPAPESALGLFFSRNMDEWVCLGLIDGGDQDWFHLTLPSIELYHDHLYFSIATTTSGTLDWGYNASLSNAIAMYEVSNFRSALERRWINYHWNS